MQSWHDLISHDGHLLVVWSAKWFLKKHKTTKMDWRMLSLWKSPKSWKTLPLCLFSWSKVLLLESWTPWSIKLSIVLIPSVCWSAATNPLSSPSTARLLWEYMCIKLACMYKHDQHPPIQDPRSQHVLSGDCSRLKINGQGLQFLFPYKWVSSLTYTGRTNR